MQEAYDQKRQSLGSIYPSVVKKWNEGRFPASPGVHEDLSIFEDLTVLADNGYGELIPIDLYVTLWVEQELYFGNVPIAKISGFRDELSGGVITNAFTLGLLDPEEVAQSWQKISAVAEAPARPLGILRGLVSWIE